MRRKVKQCLKASMRLLNEATCPKKTNYVTEALAAVHLQASTPTSSCNKMADKVDAPTTHTEAPSGQLSLVGNAAKAIIKNVDMSEEMQQESVDITSTALEKFNIEKDIAAQIKKEFDRRHGPTWHVVVGKNFGSYVTHGACFFFQIRHRKSRPGVDTMNTEYVLFFIHEFLTFSFQKRNISSISTLANLPS
jgi:dynein light chain LC8-type